MKKIEDLTAYEVIENRQIDDIGAMSWLLRHKKTGARIALLQNNDENKVFYIGFRTPPTDSTGVPHIVEHTVLCGSKDFPVKDPFVELVKGSLNTFLNAMTYSDKTVYPVASCNDKDFQNLMHVYLDAVFYPNIYQEKKIFQQEGWHYEMEDVDSPLTLNGVVYNEMKGAFSSPDEVHDREVFNSLFPDTPYGVESGGDPKVIPELTYEQFLDFHRRYYHPSNSYLYLYGDMDMAEKLEWIDENYLSRFDKLEIDSALKQQEAFAKPVEVYKEYPIMEGESLEDNTYLSYNTVVGTSLDKELYYAMEILEYALCSASAAPLKLALIHKNIGTEVYSVYNNGIYQPYFSIVAKNARESQREEFISVIEQVLADVVKKGLDKKALAAAINYFEFKYREADFGSYPRGLMLGLQSLDSWLYDESAPFMHIEANQTFERLKESIETGYFEGLIKDFILDNSHKTILMVKPVQGLTTKKDKELFEKLQEYKATLTEEKRQAIVDQTSALLAYQEEPSSEAALRTIPLLNREDMKKEAAAYINEVHMKENTTILFHELFTNGIGYLNLVFDLKQVPADLLPYVGILKAVLMMVDTKHYSYRELFNEINIHTGGIKAVANTYTNAERMEEYKLTLEIRAKALYEKRDKALELMQEVILTSQFEDTKRLYEIIAESRSRMQGTMTGAGHLIAVLRTLSYFSPTVAVSEQISGIPQYRLLEDLEKNFEDRKEDLVSILKRLTKCIFRPENLLVDYTAAKEGYAGLEEEISEFKKQLFTEHIGGATGGIEPVKKNEAFMTAGQVQYVCRAGNFMKKGLPYTGALKVLKIMMGYDYLWNNVRVKGGAYGCMCNFYKNGDAYFVSYRDPNLEKTIDVYEKAADYIEKVTLDERTVTQYIIGAISELDTPMTPATKGNYSLGGYLTGLSMERVQKERDELLATTQEQLRGLYEYVRAFMEENNLCVVGNVEKIKENKGLFMNVDQLFH
jgi:hypothetical protein